IRGFRVEPGDVAAVLRTHPGVQESVVLVAGEGEQRHLIGYVTPADGVDPTALRPSMLHDFAAQRLPDYLVPTAFKAVARFPLTANGKVDRAALPPPESQARGEAAPPRGATEERLAELWRLLPRQPQDRLPVSAPHPAPGRPAAPAPHPAQDRPATLGPHLVRLTDDWSLWRAVCLRGAGFGVHLLEALGDAELARAADAVIAADAATDREAREAAGAGYAAEFPAAVRRLSAALHEVAGLPALREAVAWQNRHALTTGIDVLVRRGPEPAKRNKLHRQHEALVASYLQRYCAKNDSIGFFGPMSWAQIDDGRGIRI